MRRIYNGVNCERDGCDKLAKSKGFCLGHYNNYYYHSLSPERKKERYKGRYLRWMEKRRQDPVFDHKERIRMRKAAKESFKRRCEREPGWNAKRQREHRKRNPDSFNFTMAKWYFLQLKGKYKAMFMRMMRDG